MAVNDLKCYKFIGINSKNERFKGTIYGTSVLNVLHKLKLDVGIASIISVEEGKKSRKTKKDYSIDKTKIRMEKISTEKISIKYIITRITKEYTNVIHSLKNVTNPFKSKGVSEGIIEKQHHSTGGKIFNGRLLTSSENEVYNELDSNTSSGSTNSSHSYNNTEYTGGLNKNKVKTSREGSAIKGESPQNKLYEKITNKIEVKKKKIPLSISDIEYVTLNKLQKVKTRDLVDFSKKMEILISSNILLVDSLIIVKESIRDKYFKKVIGNIVFNINSGHSISDSMMEYPEVFDSFYVATILLGESVGELRHSFKDLYITYKNKLVIAKKIKTASIYPLVTLIVLGLMMILGSKFFIPILRDLFSTAGIELPLITKFVFAAADNLGSIGVVIGILSVILLLGYKLIPRLNKLITFGLDIIALGLPVIGKFRNYVELYNFSTTVYTMLKNGMGLVESLELSKRVVRNSVYRKQIDLVKNELLTGKSFAELLAQYDFFDIFTSSMAKVGEESGDLETSFKNIVLYHEENIKEITDIMMELVQPMMTLLLAAIAGPLLVAIYMPLIQMMSGSTLK